MLNFSYVLTETREEIQFVSKIELDEKFQAFIGLPNRMYLFVHIDKYFEKVFSIKILNQETNEVIFYFKILIK